MYHTGEIIPVYSFYHLKNELLSVRMTVTKQIQLKHTKGTHLYIFFYIQSDQSLCAPDDYNTERGAQRLFDHPAFHIATKALCTL